MSERPQAAIAEVSRTEKAASDASYRVLYDDTM